MRCYWKDIFTLHTCLTFKCVFGTMLWMDFWIMHYRIEYNEILHTFSYLSKLIIAVMLPIFSIGNQNRLLYGEGPTYGNQDPEGV